MNRRGSALVASLWLLTMLATIAATGLTAARTSAAASRNRVLLARAEWARDGCFEILQASYERWVARHGPLDDERIGRELLGALSLDSTAFDDAVWCSVETEDAGAVLNASPGCPLFKRVNINSAPIDVLACLPGLGSDGAAALVAERRRRILFRSLDEAVAALPPNIRDRVTPAFRDFLTRATTRPPEVLIRARGFAGSPPLISTVTVVASIGGSRLDIHHRETE